MPLHEVLTARRGEVLDRWKNVVQGDLAPDATTTLEIIDHIPVFLEEIVMALRTAANLPAPGPSPEESETAAEHGAQRLRLGFSLDAVVREYGALGDAVVSVARQHNEEPTYRELQVIFDCTIAGIASAVSEYTVQRDAELHRANNEHFAFIAHELRNPMSSAGLAFQLLTEAGVLPPNNRAAAALGRSLKRTSELIDQTLQITRVASATAVHRQWTTLHALIDDVESGIASDAQSRGVDLRFQKGSDERIHVDVRLLRSAIGNLVRNGVKYTKPQTVVEVRAEVTQDHVRIEIEDCCGGLPPGKIEEMFTPFVQLDTRKDGFGLGLAIAKQAVEAHGGSIRVENLPSKGCVFIIELPGAQTAA